MPADRNGNKVARVLITGAGGPSGYCVLRNLAEEGERLELLAGDIDPCAVGLYAVAPERRVMLPRGDHPHFAELTLDRCIERGVDVLVPTVDSELIPLAERRGQFEAAGTRLVLASERTLRMCLDKWRLQKACERTVRVPRCEIADESWNPIGTPLPAFVKPRTGSGSRGIMLIETVEALERLPRDGSLLVQENLPGPEHSLDVLARSDGEVVAVVPRERLRVDSGIAICGVTKRDEALEEFGREVAERIHLTGVANVQVKETEGGEPALLEVNPRFPGTMPLTVASGVDMPKLCVGEALGRPIPSGWIDFKPIGMVRMMEELFMEPEDLQRSIEQADPAAVQASAGARPFIAEDMHVHSTFSDGSGTIAENVLEAERLGLRRMTCVDHVRESTEWVPEFVAEVAKARAETDVDLLCGIEAKLLDTSGRLDLPPSELIEGVDRIYAADHQVPMADGPHHPAQIREGIQNGDLDSVEVLEAIVASTAAAIANHDNVVIAHLFSVLPKIGIDEANVSTELLERLAEAAVRGGARIEVDERWSCPSARTVAFFVARVVPLLFSTDSHRPATIARYAHCASVRTAVADLAPTNGDYASTKSREPAGNS